MKHDSKSWQQIQAVFERALELTIDARSAFVAEELRDRPDLSLEVDTLLASFDSSESFELGAIAQWHLDDAIEAPYAAMEGYELGDELHRGGQGVVFRARQLSTDRDVAIKFLLHGTLGGETRTKRFVREIQVASGLSHPGIVPVFDSGSVKGHHYFVMPLVEGLPLSDHIATHAGNQEALLDVFAKLCDAVGHGHDKAVVHRDLKPANILVDAAGQPRVLDFGLAKLGGVDPEEHPQLSMTGQVMGTLAYMSPEQAIGRSDAIGAPSDVYALGVMLYEAFTGQPPYRLSSGLVENLQAIHSVAPALEPLKTKRIANDLRTIILKALAKEPDRRYPNASALGRDLRLYCDGKPIEAKRDRSLYRLRKKLPAYGRHATVAIIAMLGAILLIDWSTSPSSPPPLSLPLATLPSGQLHSAADLERQVFAIRDMIRFQHGGERILSATVERFEGLDASQFEPEMDPMSRDDLKLLQSLAKFLASNPDRSTLTAYVSSLSRHNEARNLKPSGLASEIAVSVLRLAVESIEGTPGVAGSTQLRDNQRSAP
ncbi:MAG: serine/threonine-protein kinase [Planctomycetota bacterium]